MLDVIVFGRRCIWSISQRVVYFNCDSIKRLILSLVPFYGLTTDAIRASRERSQKLLHNLYFLACNLLLTCLIGSILIWAVFNRRRPFHNFLTIKWDTIFSIHHCRKVKMANDIESQFTNELSNILMYKPTFIINCMC